MWENRLCYEETPSVHRELGQCPPSDSSSTRKTPWLCISEASSPASAVTRVTVSDLPMDDEASKLSGSCIHNSQVHFYIMIVCDTGKLTKQQLTQSGCVRAEEVFKICTPFSLSGGQTNELSEFTGWQISSSSFYQFNFTLALRKFLCSKKVTSANGNEEKKNVHLSGWRQVTFLVYAIHALSHLVFAAHITFHVREHTGLVGPQVILGAEEQHRELTDVMFHFLDVDRNCPRMANLSWPPPATQGRADEIAGDSLLPTNSEVHYCMDTWGKSVWGLPVRLVGDKRLLEEKSTHFTSHYLNTKKAAALYPAEMSSFSPRSPWALHGEGMGTTLFYLHLPVAPNFHPDYFLVVWLFACLAIITIPASLWHLNV